MQTFCSWHTADIVCCTFIWHEIEIEEYCRYITVLVVFSRSLTYLKVFAFSLVSSRFCFSSNDIDCAYDILPLKIQNLFLKEKNVSLVLRQAFE